MESMNQAKEQHVQKLECLEGWLGMKFHTKTLPWEGYGYFMPLDSQTRMFKGMVGGEVPYQNPAMERV